MLFYVDVTSNLHRCASGSGSLTLSGGLWDFFNATSASSLSNAWLPAYIGKWGSPDWRGAWDTDWITIEQLAVPDAPVCLFVCHPCVHSVLLLMVGSHIDTLKRSHEEQCYLIYLRRNTSLFFVYAISLALLTYPDMLFLLLAFFLPVWSSASLFLAAA